MGLGGESSLCWCKCVLMHPMTIFLEDYYVPDWSPVLKDEGRKESISETQLPKVSCHGLRGKDGLRTDILFMPHL